MKFPDPPAGQPSWLALAQAVFNEQVGRWDTATCKGGLRWQIYTFNAGYDYKNTISTGGFFQLAARLARFTGNQTYADWAETAFDWMQQSPLITSDWKIWDGTAVGKGCIDADQIYWTYNYGTMLMGSAFMYNYVCDPLNPNDISFTLFVPSKMATNVLDFRQTVIALGMNASTEFSAELTFSSSTLSALKSTQALLRPMAKSWLK